jgi:hypothetical protein
MERAEHPSLWRAKDPGFTVEDLRGLLRDLLAQVRLVTGYQLINDDLA